MREYVAIDLETTGLDVESDRVTEVGCVRFDERGPIERFSSLVNPGKEIPYRIRVLTGIEQRDVEGAPIFGEITQRLRKFIGDRPVVGQNISFDVNFLAAEGLRLASPAYDTFEMASLLVPALPEYSLRHIASHLGIAFPVQHRALPDAEAAMQVFLALRRRAAELDIGILAELARLAPAAKYSFAPLLEELSAAAGPAEVIEISPAWLIPPVRSEPLRARDQTLGVRPAEIEQALTLPARRPDAFPGFEDRREQLLMAKAVGSALSAGEHLVVEAGTGTGKSLAYLVPAALFALRNGSRVVVSTDTISLQEQLLAQEIPATRTLLAGSGVTNELRATQLKGRQNYLCLRRWSALRRSATLAPEEARLLARLLVWLPRTETGDRAELNLTPAEEAVWNRISADTESCLATGSPFVQDGTCFMLRARQRAEDAHVVVVNHALLLSDVARGGRSIPSYHEIIIDEAHNLEDEATQQFGFRADAADLTALLDRIGSRATEGVLSLAGTARFAVDRLSRADRLRSRLSPEIDELEILVATCRVQAAQLFEAIVGFVRLQEPGERETRLLLTRSVRAQPDWIQVELAWESLAVSLDRLSELIEAIGALIEEEGGGEPAVDELGSMAVSAKAAVDLLRQGLHGVLDRHIEAVIAWVDASRGPQQLAIASAPLEVNGLLQARLFDEKRAVVLTGATLSAHGSCDYLQSRVGTGGAKELILGSPFEYERSTLVGLPTDIPEPEQAGYQAAIERAVIELTRASGGRALVLVTSHSALRATRAGIREALERDGILVLGQGVDGSARQLLQALKTNSRTVLLGAASFWEGVDVTGEALSLLLMTRLPFPVPTDPIFASRAELFEDPFSEFSVPQAVLRFKQGFGRLIRRKTDRGAFVVLDRRIQTRSYGEAFLGALPRTAVVRESASSIAERVGRWLSRP